MYKNKFLVLILMLHILLSKDLSYGHSGFSVENFINQKDPFSISKLESGDSVIKAPYELYKERQFLDCYKVSEKVLETGKAGGFKDDLLSLMLTCYVSSSKRKRPEFNTKYDFFSNPVLIKKVFRDLGHNLIRNMIKAKEVSMNNEELFSFILEKPSVICLFKEKKDFANQVLNRIAKRDDFYSLSLGGLPCDYELNDDYRELFEDRETYSLFLKKGASVFFKRPPVRFKYLKKKISKKEYSRFRRLSKRNKIKFLKDIKAMPDYVVNKIVKNLFYQNKYSLLQNISNNESIPNQSLSYLVKTKAAEGKYDEVLSLSSGIKISKSQWIEEILLMRAGAFFRKDKFEDAEKELDKMLKNSVNLKLSALYWRWVALNKLKRKSEALAVSKKIIKSYPFSYFGLLVSNFNEGVDFFDKYNKRYADFSVSLESVSQKDIDRLKTFYKLNWVSAFKEAYFQLSDKLMPKEKALFALAFNNLGQVQESIKILNNEWDNDADLRAEPFISTSFSFLFSDFILKEAAKNERVNAPIIRAIIRQESAFQEKVKSGSGAKGLMQLMNPTARELARQLRVKRFNPNRNLYDAAINVKLGSKYMDRLIFANKGYLPYAFASYNAGPGKMNRWSTKREEIYNLKKGLDNRVKALGGLNEFWIEELPWVETRFYAKALLRNMGIYTALSGQKKSFECEPFWICQ